MIIIIIIQDFFLRFTRLKHVLLVPVPPITTRTRRTRSHSGPGPTTHHPQLRTKSVPWCSSSPFYQTVDNYLVIWVYIYYHKIIYKHVLFSRHRCSNSTGNHNSDNKNNNKMICEKGKQSSIVSRVCVHHIW